MIKFKQFFESKKSYSYSSVLYMLPDSVGKKIYNWGLKNIKEEDLYYDSEESGYGREDDMHCTVVFGIHDKTSKTVRKILKEVAPFTIKLGKINAFTTPDKFDVVKVEVVGSELHKLHHQICDNIEVTDSYPEYRPHATIAYVKKGKSKKYIGSNVFKDISMKVDKVVFSSRSGVKYPILLRSL